MAYNPYDQRAYDQAGMPPPLPQHPGNYPYPQGYQGYPPQGHQGHPPHPPGAQYPPHPPRAQYPIPPQYPGYYAGQANAEYGENIYESTRKPINTICFACHHPGITFINYRMGSQSWILVIILAFLSLGLLCWIPFLLDSCKDAVHTCTGCTMALGSAPPLMQRTGKSGYKVKLGGIGKLKIGGKSKPY